MDDLVAKYCGQKITFIDEMPVVNRLLCEEVGHNAGSY